VNKSGVHLTDFHIRDLNQILERDATDTTYKFALLRAVSDVCQRHGPLRKNDEWVWFPTGYLVERWLEYYYPIIDSDLFIPQKGSEKELGESGYKIAFRALFKKVTSFYRERGGFGGFWIDYKKGQIPGEINDVCLELVIKLWDTITRYPMKHLGYSARGEHYAFFQFSKKSVIKRRTQLSQALLLDEFGEFSVNSGFFDTLRLFGSYISGEYSILNKWVDFTVKSDSSGMVAPSYVFEVLNTKPESERDVGDARDYYFNLFKKQRYLECTWSDTRIRSWNNVHIDHVIPFSLWGNNDLWNLLPAHKRYNSQKSDLIPSISMLESRRDQIISYWELLENYFKYRFNKEIEYNLLDSKRQNTSMDNIFAKLIKKCEYLIDVRGFSEWTLKV